MKIRPASKRPKRVEVPQMSRVKLLGRAEKLQNFLNVSCLPRLCPIGAQVNAVRGVAAAAEAAETAAAVAAAKVAATAAAEKAGAKEATEAAAGTAKAAGAAKAAGTANAAAAAGAAAAIQELCRKRTHYIPPLFQQKNFHRFQKVYFPHSHQQLYLNPQLNLHLNLEVNPHLSLPPHL